MDTNKAQNALRALGFHNCTTQDVKALLGLTFMIRQAARPAEVFRLVNKYSIAALTILSVEEVIELLQNQGGEFWAQQDYHPDAKKDDKKRAALIIFRDHVGEQAVRDLLFNKIDRKVYDRIMLA